MADNFAISLAGLFHQCFVF